MIHEALHHISPSTYYPEVLGSKANPAKCPFHHDRLPSFGYNAKTGAGICHASSCGAKFPHIVAFHRRLKSLPSDLAAAEDLWERYVHPLQPRERAVLMHQGLTPALRQLLLDERLLEVSTIETHLLGYDHEHDRIAIPVWLDRKHLAGFRYWLPKAARADRDTEPKIFHDSGLPHVLFNGHAVLADVTGRSVFFMSSELDALLATQDGFLAVAGMRGEGKTNPSWAPYLRRRHVVVCMGADDSTAAARIAAFAKACGASVGLVDWPSKGRKTSKDYTDFRKAGIIDSQWLTRFASVGGTPDEPTKVTVPVGDIALVPFNKATSAAYVDRAIRVCAMVSGVDYEHYLVPKKLQAELDGTVVEYEVDTDRDLLYFLDTSEHAFPNFIRNRLELPVRAPLTKVKATEVIEAYRCQLTPDISDGDHTKFAQYTALSVGAKPEANSRYEITATPVADPRSQMAVLVIRKLKDLGTRNCALSSEALSALRKDTAPLRARNLNQLREVVAKLCDNLAARTTRIISRPDLHLATVLSFICPNAFAMEGRMQRGWLQALIVGDSRTGKSEAAKHIGKLFKAGEVISSENCSFVGLVGGLQKQGDRFLLVWGRIPRNHLGHLTIEELSSMAVEDIARLTDVRSSGVARLDKGGFSHQTHAETRQLYLSNPRGGASISRHSNAVRVIQKLIGANEDIARFDVILAQGAEEVSIQDINAFLRGNARHVRAMVPDDAWPALVGHIWSLGSKAVYMTPEAEEKAREVSVELATAFHYEVPIFKAEDGRYKLARIGAALACLTLHEDKQGRIKVCSWHIEYAAEFLKRIWTKECFGYDKFSRAYLEGDAPDPAELTRIIREHTGGGVPFVAFCDMIGDRETFTLDDLCECAALDRTFAQRFLQSLHIKRVARRLPDSIHGGRARWTLTPAFRKLLAVLASKPQPK